MCNNTRVCLSLCVRAFQRAFWWIEKNCTWNGQKKKYARPPRLRGWQWQTIRLQFYPSPAIVIYGWNAATSNSNFCYQLVVAAAVFFSFNLLFCSHNHRQIPFLLLSTPPSNISVCECTGAYVLLLFCVCVFNDYATTRTMRFTVNLANIKSVVITDYVVHIAWSCLGWQSWLDTWKNRKNIELLTHTIPISHT